MRYTCQSLCYSESIYHWQNVRNFGPIFEQNGSINFEPILEKSVNFGHIFEKIANFGPILETMANFEHFVNRRWTVSDSFWGKMA